MIPFSGVVWRAVPEGQDPLCPATAPEGRFHHAGQFAVYTSLTAEGTKIAIARYLTAADPDRIIHPLRVDAARVRDLRDETEASVVWQDVRATGRAAPTWSFSDDARASGAQALLYSSRSRPDLSHLVIFDPSVLCAAPDHATRRWTSP